MVVAEQDLGDLERVVHVALPDEIGGTDDGGAAFPHAFGARQLPQNAARLVEQVAADHVRRAEVDQVPIVDLVDAPQVQVEQLLPAASGVLLLRPCLSMMLAPPARTSWTGPLEQLLDLAGQHLDELLGEREDLPHAHANKLVAFAVLALAGLEVTLVLLSLLRRTVRLQLFDKSLCRGVVDMSRSVFARPRVRPATAAVF